MAGFETRERLTRIEKTERTLAERHAQMLIDLESRVKALEDGQEDVLARAQMYANQAMALVGQAEAILRKIEDLAKPNPYPNERISGG